jgi:hypothetical protein
VWNDVDDAGQELMLAMDIAFQSSLEEDLAANTTSGDKHTARGDARVFNFVI